MCTVDSVRTWKLAFDGDMDMVFAGASKSLSLKGQILGNFSMPETTRDSNSRMFLTNLPSTFDLRHLMIGRECDWGAKMGRAAGASSRAPRIETLPCKTERINAPVTVIIYDYFSLRGGCSLRLVRA